MEQDESARYYNLSVSGRLSPGITDTELAAKITPLVEELGEITMDRTVQISLQPTPEALPIPILLTTPPLLEKIQVDPEILTENLSDLGAKLRRAREAAGYSVDDLSSRIRLGPTALARLEKGNRMAGKQLRPKGHTLLRICEALGLDPEPFLDLAGYRRITSEDISGPRA